MYICKYLCIHIHGSTQRRDKSIFVRNNHTCFRRPPKWFLHFFVFDVYFVIEIFYNTYTCIYIHVFVHNKTIFLEMEYISVTIYTFSIFQSPMWNIDYGVASPLTLSIHSCCFSNFYWIFQIAIMMPVDLVCGHMNPQKNLSWFLRMRVTVRNTANLFEFI